MEVRKIISRVVGVLQSGIGASSVILACILYYNLFAVQGLLNVTAKNVPFYMLLLFIFGFLSIISGFFLVYD